MAQPEDNKWFDDMERIAAQSWDGAMSWTVARLVMKDAEDDMAEFLSKLDTSRYTIVHTGITQMMSGRILYFLARVDYLRRVADPTIRWDA